MSNSQSNIPGNRRLPPLPMYPATSAPGPPAYLPPFPATNAASRSSAYTPPNAAPRPPAYTPPNAAPRPPAYTSPLAASRTYTSPYAASASSAYTSPHAASASSAYTSPNAASGLSAYTSPHAASASSAYTSPYAASASSAYTSPYAASASSAYTSPYTASGSSAYTSPYAPLNAAPQPSSNTFPYPPLIAPSPLNQSWDSQADAITMTGHRLGETTLEISKRLIKAGYSVTRNEVAASLQKQGVKDVNWGSVANSRCWDAQADSFVMAAHRTGKPRTEILRLLHQRGYSSSITTVEITASLHKQETMERNRKREVPILAGERAWWDPRADSLALAAYRGGKTVEEISQQLTATGIAATKVQVLTSLKKQGVEDVTWGDHSAGKKRPS